jgi:putative FmdB family regulatory protein
MPTYEYRCKACEHEFEVFQSMKDSPKRTCPECGKRTLERLIGTGAAVIFKGSGFYQTDYRSESYKKAAEKEKPDGKSDRSDTGDKATPNKADKTESKTAGKSTESSSAKKSDSKAKSD